MTMLLDRLNSITKYPSIPTYHVLGPKGIPTEERAVDFDGEEILVTEKIDGANARIIWWNRRDRIGIDSDEWNWIIGSREQLLTADGDVIRNHAMQIVEALLATRFDVLESPATDDGIVVYYLEVYGGKTTAGAKNYTASNALDVRLFDVLKIPWSQLYRLLDLELSQISALRDAGEIGTWRSDDELMSGVANAWRPFPLVPRLATPLPPPPGPSGMIEWLDGLFERRRTLACIDGVPGAAEGVVIRTPSRNKIAKIRFEDYKKLSTAEGRMKP